MNKIDFDIIINNLTKKELINIITYFYFFEKNIAQHQMNNEDNIHNIVGTAKMTLLNTLSDLLTKPDEKAIAEHPINNDKNMENNKKLDDVNNQANAMILDGIHYNIKSENNTKKVNTSLNNVSRKKMDIHDIAKLKIYDKVIVEPLDDKDLDKIGSVTCIDFNKKIIGVTNYYNDYIEVPFNRILKKINFVKPIK